MKKVKICYGVISLLLLTRSGYLQVKDKIREKMRWFEGGITEAIAVSRQQNALFIVNIQQPPGNHCSSFISYSNYKLSVEN